MSPTDRLPPMITCERCKAQFSQKGHTVFAHCDSCRSEIQESTPEWMHETFPRWDGTLGALVARSMCGPTDEAWDCLRCGSEFVPTPTMGGLHPVLCQVCTRRQAEVARRLGRVA